MADTDSSEGNVQAKLNKLYDDMARISQSGVADGSITSSKIVNGSVTTEKITDGAVTRAKTDFELFLVPSGFIGMWSGNTVPTGWYLCNGQNGTPDLRDRFIVSTGSSYSIGDKGGVNTVSLTTAEMPAHTHTVGSTEVKWTGEAKEDVNVYSGKNLPAPGYMGSNATVTYNIGSHTHSLSSTGSGAAHENRPPYYALAFIMKA